MANRSAAIHPLLNRMHHYLGAENVPSTETYCGGAMGFKDGVETLSTDGRRRRAVLPGLGERERDLVNYFAIYPNFLHQFVLKALKHEDHEGREA
ncbi:MAG: Benzene 1,2-dioxygenase subunit alpha [Acidobacteriota bacterium]